MAKFAFCPRLHKGPQSAVVVLACKVQWDEQKQRVDMVTIWAYTGITVYTVGLGANE